MKCSEAGPCTSYSSKTHLRALCATEFLASATIPPNGFYFKLEKYRTRDFEQHMQRTVDKICSWLKMQKLQGCQ